MCDERQLQCKNCEKININKGIIKKTIYKESEIENTISFIEDRFKVTSYYCPECGKSFSGEDKIEIKN